MPGRCVHTPRNEKGTVLHVRSTSIGMWTARPGEGRYAHRDPAGRSYPTYDRPTVRPGELAGEYFAGQVPAPARHRVTPRGVAWALALFFVQCVWLRFVLGYPGFGDSAAANDRTTSAWLPLFLLACASAPLVAVALAADRERTDPYSEVDDVGHPVWIPVISGVLTALAGLGLLAVAVTTGPHTVGAVALGCGVAAAALLGAAVGLLTVHRPVLRTPVCWAVLAIWVGLTLRRAFVWAVAPHVVTHAHVPAALDAAVPYAPALLAVGVAGTALIGGIGGFVRSRGQAPLLAAIAGLWLCATGLSVLGPGVQAFAEAPWRLVAGSLGGAVAGVLVLAVRSWWKEYR